MSIRYVEVVIEGRRSWALGFVQGFLCAQGVGEQALDAEAEGVDCERLQEQLAELLHPSMETLHLLVPEALVSTVREAAAAGAVHGHPIAVRHERSIAGARFTFSLSVASREHAKRIRGLFERLPPGARLTEGTTFDEVVHPEAAGVELYAPAHDYGLQGRGGVEGALDGVLTVYRVCRGDNLIRTSAAILVPEQA